MSELNTTIKIDLKLFEIKIQTFGRLHAKYNLYTLKKNKQNITYVLVRNITRVYLSPKYTNVASQNHINVSLMYWLRFITPTGSWCYL